MIVSVAPVTAPVAAKLARVAAPEAVSVPVDTSPAALAVLLMVRVLPVIPVAELSRPTLAAPVMLSELPDTAPVDDSVALATVPNLRRNLAAFAHFSAQKRAVTKR